MNRSRDKGTRWASAIVDALHAHGWPYVERRAQAGAKDRGDIAGIPNIVIEAKDAERVKLAEWLNEAHTEAANDSPTSVGVVWFHRRGYSSADRGYVLMDGETFMRLLKEAGH